MSGHHGEGTGVPEGVARLLGEVVGEFRLRAIRSRNRHGTPVVWEVEDRNGHGWYAKRHNNRLMFDRETRAYDEFVPALGARRTARLAGRNPEGLLIVTRAVKGLPLSVAQLDPVLEREAYRQAGVLAARLHGQHPPEDAVHAPTPWDVQRRRALDLALDLALPAEDVAVLAAATAAPPPVLPVAVCHGDYSPRNWLVERADAGLRLRVIDFERTSVEEPVRHDLMRVLYQLTPGRPALREAFFDGYGRTLSAEEESACRGWAAIDCPSALKWAREHQDKEILAYARTALDLLRSPRAAH
ncbi:L-amino acid N-acyltransferase YncA [Streptacidiphilus sp. BW17]|uniref:phosphotransferase family protein n=1 Tax=unclassified Streptacidiphilus TaxID=2643834 RepID=UPI003514A31B